jgi:hypothetical protein
MAGFNDGAGEAVAFPPDHAVHALVAVGVHAPGDAAKEERPNGRRPVDELLVKAGVDRA